MDDNRKHPRHPFHLKVALHMPGSQPTVLHGETNDISLDGAAILLEHNVFTNEEFLVEVLIPPTIVGKPAQTLKIRSKMVYTLYSSDHHCFRTGLIFRKYLENAKALLETKLAQGPKITG